MASERAFNARKPSNETLTLSRYSNVGVVGALITYSAACETTLAGARRSQVFARLHRAPAAPRIPFGMNSVTKTNNPPSAKSQYSGSAPVNQVLPALTTIAPRIAPA